MGTAIIKRTGDSKQRYHTNSACPQFEWELHPGEKCETCAVLNSHPDYKHLNRGPRKSKKGKSK